MKFTFLKNNTLGSLLVNVLLSIALFFIIVFLYLNVYLHHVTKHNSFVEVPDLTGMSITSIDSYLKEYHLRYIIFDSSYNENLPPNTIIYQVPQPSLRVKPGRQIYLSINRITRPTLPMPDLIDRSLINAKVVLASNQLKLGEIEFVQ